MYVTLRNMFRQKWRNKQATAFFVEYFAILRVHITNPLEIVWFQCRKITLEREGKSTCTQPRIAHALLDMNVEIR